MKGLYRVLCKDNLQMPDNLIAIRVLWPGNGQFGKPAARCYTRVEYDE